jgi:hypothetical protein
MKWFVAKTRRFVALAIAILLVGATGCSHFNRDWGRAGVTLQAAGSVEGRWEGMWESDVDHHHGKLRCLLTEETNSTYKAQFRATFGGILKYHYTAHFEMQPHATLGWEFNGEANLGRLAGGSYYYEGRATRTNMISIYRSKYDHGTFHLHRP